jgi:hypothetical protein
MRRPIYLLAVGALALVLVAACGGDDHNGSRAAGTPAPPLVLGPQNTCDRDLATTPPDVTVYGGDPGDYLGDRFSLATGDFNGDGAGDILAGAPLGDGPANDRENSGEAHVIFGGPSPTAVIDLDTPRSTGATFHGGAPGDNFGFTVAAGDVNGDGVDDVLAGARFAGGPDRPAGGLAYIFLGGPDLTGDLQPEDADLTITGAATNDFLSIALASGDINGDGIDDILLGASGADAQDGSRADAGAVIVVRGSEELPHAIDLAFERPLLTVFGAAAGDSVPNHLAAGDLDGDGSEELIIGAPFADSADFEDAGRVYVIAGGRDGTVDLAEGADSELAGATRKDAMGFEVASDDVNGDGVADLLAGARDADGPSDQVNNSGEIHVMLGGEDLPREVDLANGSSDALITSTDEGDSLGFTVAAADINGDGAADIIAGAPLADGCSNTLLDAGDVYVINGRNPMPATITLHSTGDLTFLGAQEGDAAGFSAGATDFNADGRLDVVIGALQADGPENSREDAGEVWVVFGQ